MLFRGFDSDLSVRGDGRTVYGYAVPYDVDAIVNDGFGDYVERFQHLAFRNVVKQPHRVRFQYAHTDDLLAWIGNAVVLREDKGRGLYGEFRVDNTERGKQAVYKIHDQQLPGLSVGYRPSDRQSHNIMDVRSDGLQRITRTFVSQLEHVAAVETPAYPNVEPLAVRQAAREQSSVERWREWRATLMVSGDGHT